MKILVTGSNGFIAQNLLLRLSTITNLHVVTFNRSTPLSSLSTLLQDVSVVFHLAGCNRSESSSDFQKENVELTSSLLSAVAIESARQNKKIKLIFSSSIHAEKPSVYGRTKLAAENLIRQASTTHSINSIIYRLPNVFGKFSRPNYNSAIATFCHNISRDLPIYVSHPEHEIELLYIDDLITLLEAHLYTSSEITTPCQVVRPDNTYTYSLQYIVDQLYAFKDSTTSLFLDHVGTGFNRALFSTYVSFLPNDSFSFKITSFSDDRGSFTEFFKTKSSGQFSFFTAHPGVTRGCHYHHTKTERFLVVQGTAKFTFKHLLTDQSYELITSSKQPEIVITIPGWIHSIENISPIDLIAIVWANEVFDKSNPDTFSAPNPLA